MTAVILQGKADQLPLPDSSVDLLLTSPPYWSLRSYSDGGKHYEGQIGSEPTAGEYISRLVNCTREWVRVLKPEGSMFINLGDKYGRGTRTTVHGSNSKTGYVDDGETGRCIPTGNDKSLLGLPWRYALACVDTLGLILRAEIIWSKVNGLPESVSDRVRRSHEQVFHFVKNKKYFTAVDEIREEHSPVSVARGKRNRFVPDHSQDGAGTPNTLDPGKMCNPLGKLPGSVWGIPSLPLLVPQELGVKHFAAFPPELCRRIILGWSPPGGVVVDPFGGSGTAAMTASVLGRTGISVDLSHDYCRLARWRTGDEVQRARVLRKKVGKPRAKQPKAPADQPSLW